MSTDEHPSGHTSRPIESRAPGEIWMLRLGMVSWLGVLALTLVLGGCDQSDSFSHDLLVTARDVKADSFKRNADLASRLHVAAVVVHWMGAVHRTLPNYSALAKTGRPVVLEVQFLGQLTNTNMSEVEAALRDEIERADASRVNVVGVSVDYRSPNHLDSYAAMLARWHHDVLPTGLLLISSVQLSWTQTPFFSSVASVVDEFVLFTGDLADPSVGYFDRDTVLESEQVFERRSPKPFLLALPAGGMTIYRDERGVLLGTEDFPPSFEVSQTKKVRSVVLSVLPDQLRSVMAQVSTPERGRLRGIFWAARFSGEGPPAWSATTWRDLLQPVKRRGGLKLLARETGQAGLWDIVVENPFDIDFAMPKAIGMGVECSFTVPQRDYASWYAPDARSVGLRRTRVATIGPGQSITVGLAHCAARPAPDELSLNHRDNDTEPAIEDDDHP